MKYLHILKAEGIEWCGILPLSLCRVRLPHLLPTFSGGQSPQSVICFLVPYYTGDGENISTYAVSKDYHLYMNDLFSRVCQKLSAHYVGEAFVGYADHSPIDERHAALSCGLGVLGKNRLLINQEYGSYVFIGAIFSSMTVESLGTANQTPPSTDGAFDTCLRCGACLRACKSGTLRDEGCDCLSNITQKKGELTEDEAALVRSCGSVWGCDACQTVCPMNTRKETPIPFFHEDRLTNVDEQTLLHMEDDVFRSRAYAWRGKAPILRNVRLLNEKKIDARTDTSGT